MPPSPLPSPSAPPPLSWPFTGRDHDIATVAAALARDGAVVLAGAAGVGKSRLARELAARIAPHDPVQVARASASARDVPLGAFAHWLTPGRADEGDTATLARTAETLRADGPRSVLLVDDAHVLDPTSAALLNQLATDRAVRIVVTVRTGTVCPDAVTAMWKDGVATRVDVTPLTEETTAALLEAALEGPVDARAARRLHEVTVGNVLWLRHLVEGERAAGRLTAARSGRWEWNGQPVLSPALEQLIGERLGTLDDGERRVIELVALGEPVGLPVLVALAGADEVERVADRDLVTVHADGARTEVRLGHPLYGDAARSRLSLPRARRLRGELSRALRDTGARRAGDQLRRAVLDLDGDTPRDPRLLVGAAQQAIALTDNRLAERLLDAAAEAGGGFDPVLSLAFLLSWELRAEESSTALARAMELATTTDERMRAFLVRVQVVFFVLDRPEEGMALLAAEEARTPDRPEPAVCRTLLRAVGGEVGAAADDALALIGRDDLTVQARCWACWPAAYTLAFRGGESDRVQEIVDQGVAAAHGSPETGVMVGNIAFAGLQAALYAARHRAGPPDLARRPHRCAGRDLGRPVPGQRGRGVPAADGRPAPDQRPRELPRARRRLVVPAPRPHRPGPRPRRRHRGRGRRAGHRAAVPPALGPLLRHRDHDRPALGRRRAGRPGGGGPLGRGGGHRESAPGSALDRARRPPPRGPSRRARPGRGARRARARPAHPAGRRERRPRRRAARP
ncbi:hypothetical protein GCM10023200_58560 [Actinomycetospora chlora]|uniref:AAA+ ATPase domain-containing protein n=1 Tax=Actinomycetospora chlora TaxID=663608 RepID=A0ABP9CKE0_9PSEU